MGSQSVQWVALVMFAFSLWTWARIFFRRHGIDRGWRVRGLRHMKAAHRLSLARVRRNFHY